MEHVKKGIFAEGNKYSFPREDQSRLLSQKIQLLTRFHVKNEEF